jgi:hypothetical protein
LGNPNIKDLIFNEISYEMKNGFGGILPAVIGEINLGNSGADLYLEAIGKYLDTIP